MEEAADCVNTSLQQDGGNNPSSAPEEICRAPENEMKSEEIRGSIVKKIVKAEVREGEVLKEEVKEEEFVKEEEVVEEEIMEEEVVKEEEVDEEEVKEEEVVKEEEHRNLIADRYELFGSSSEEEEDEEDNADFADAELEKWVDESSQSKYESEASQQVEAKPLEKPEILSYLPWNRPSSDAELLLLQKSGLPKFEPNPFDREDFSEQLAALSTESSTELQNVVRWRYVMQGDALAVESNSKLVRWSDGSLSLHVGSTAMPVNEQSLAHEYHHLFSFAEDDSTVSQDDGRIMKKVVILPLQLGPPRGVMQAKNPKVKMLLPTLDVENDATRVEIAEAEAELDASWRRREVEYGGPLTASFLEEDNDFAGDIGAIKALHGMRKGPVKKRRKVSDVEERLAEQKILQAKHLTSSQPVRKRKSRRQ